MIKYKAMFINPLEWLYRGAWLLWDGGYRTGLFPTRKVLPKVISVGSLTWGGSGKTPTVEYLARGIAKRESKIAVLSRGYGSPKDRQQADEVQWLMQKLDGILVFADPDRVASAKKAEKQGCQFLILDDGFQHRRLNRQLDIITIDATDPFGNGRLIPAGKLREPLQSLKRASRIILTKTDLVSDGKLSQIKEKIQKIIPWTPIAETIYRPVCLLPVILSEVREAHEAEESKKQDGRNKKTIYLNALKDQNVGLVAAIGNPEAFKRTIEKLGARVTQTYFKRDHSHYSAADFQKMEAIQKKNSLFCWVTTSKDAVKMRRQIGQAQVENGDSPQKAGTVPIFTPIIYELEIELVFKKGERELWQAIESL